MLVEQPLDRGVLYGRVGLDAIVHLQLQYHLGEESVGMGCVDCVAAIGATSEAMIVNARARFS